MPTLENVTNDKKQLTSYRRFDIGFVFQFYNLVQNLTALENVELAAQICKDPLPAPTVLEEVGLKDRLLNFPAQLSGGEQQRVAIAVSAWLCVMTTTVFPFSRQVSCNNFKTAFPVL